MNCSSKKYGYLFLIIGILGLSFLLTQVFIFNKYAMDNIDVYVPANTNNYIGGWNFFAYFTFLSNVFVDLFLICLGLTKLGVRWSRKIALNVCVQGPVTVYIFITGLIYWTILKSHIVLYDWNGPLAFANIVNFWNHLIMPLFMTVLWFFPLSTEKTNKKIFTATLSFPIIYLVFSTIRGYIKDWFPYPFLNPKQLWNYLIGDIPFVKTKGYIMYVAFILMIGIVIVATTMLLKIIRDKKIEKQIKKVG